MSLPYVFFCDDDVKLRDVSDELGARLILSGARKGDRIGEYYFPLTTNNDRVVIFARLRDLGFAFAGGREWSPAEQFEELRDRGELSGKYTCILWRGPGDVVIQEK